MVLPSFTIHPNTQNTLQTITVHHENANQAMSILRRSITSMQKKQRTIEQLWFMKTCKQENLSTERVNKMTERLGLRPTQEKRLRKSMMANLERDLYKELAKRTKENEDATKAAKRILDAQEYSLFERKKAEELEFCRRSSRNHFRERLGWIKKCNEKRRNEETPDIIDGILMNDQPLDDTYELKIRQYGGVSLDENEKEVLKLPPKYAVFETPNQLDFKANLEKTFNRIRWKRQFEEVEKQKAETELNTVTGSVATPKTEVCFFNEESKTFNGKNLSASSLPFNKRVCIPECAED